MPADAVMPISVVIERRETNSPWQDHVWTPIGVLPLPASEPGTRLAEGEGWVQFQGGTLDLELFHGETEGYLTNLSQARPAVFVVLRRSEDGDGPEFVPFLATACPNEAMGYSEGNDDLVEAVPMPPAVADWVRAFVAMHHVDEPFIKRKNRRHEDDYGGTEPPSTRGRGVS
jgi:hypothetical protein